MFGALFFAGYAFFSHLLPENCSKPDFVPRTFVYQPTYGICSALHPCIALLMTLVALYIRVSAYLWHL